ncbi:MAG: NUDIX domain-containing protein, partial [Defluviitaleaceae bacterium]|nr:NUDIX domain-containing protein [Defluviitaleaceae bacterium]
WETQSGSAASGEDSLTAALKETREEVGIVLNPANGEYYCRVTRTDNICDVWIFRQDVELSDVVLQEGETCDAALMSGEKILQMIKEETFIGFEFYPYLLEMFEYLRKDLTR